MVEQCATVQSVFSTAFQSVLSQWQSLYSDKQQLLDFSLPL